MVSMGYLDSQHRYPIRSERGGSALGKKKKKRGQEEAGNKWQELKVNTHTQTNKKSRFEVRSAKKADKASVFAKRDDGDFVLCVWSSSRRFCYMQAHIVKTKGKPFTLTFLLKNLPFLTVRTQTITRAHVVGAASRRRAALHDTVWKKNCVFARVWVTGKGRGQRHFEMLSYIALFENGFLGGKRLQTFPKKIQVASLKNVYVFNYQKPQKWTINRQWRFLGSAHRTRLNVSIN